MIRTHDIDLLNLREPWACERCETQVRYPGDAVSYVNDTRAVGLVISIQGNKATVSWTRAPGGFDPRAAAEALAAEIDREIMDDRSSAQR